jgi:hypothetical protein
VQGEILVAGKEILIKAVALAQANPDLLQWNVLI